MNPIGKVLIVALVLSSGSLALADSEKDCLLRGTVMHDDQTGQDATTVKIHSISKYDAESRCNVRRNQKLEFKLPPDPRLKEAPSGSEVEYRYRTDDNGQSAAELISVGA
jgi:hypothetical protein